MYLGFNGFLLYHDSKFPHSPLSPFKIERTSTQWPGKELILTTLKKGLLSHLTLQPLAAWFGFGLLKDRGALSTNGELPFFQLVVQFAAIQFVENLTFFLTHRMLHTRVLYALFHKQHHEYRGPNGFGAEYAHPVEQIFGNYGPALLGIVLTKSSMKVWFIWLMWRLWATYERHSGYCFSGTFLGKLGLLNGRGALFHDDHHRSTRHCMHLHVLPLCIEHVAPTTLLPLAKIQEITDLQWTYLIIWQEHGYMMVAGMA
jgi:sterol desaturase/sphingolipid hydroxylase (fatty acid hydroxylase superfamily)